MRELISGVFGLEIPEAGPIFAAALVVHIIAALTGVISGAIAASAKKRRGRHPRFGTIYYWSLIVVFGTAAIMSAIRWAEDSHLFGIAAVALLTGTIGYVARKRRRRGWMRIHIPGMGLSYVALLTGFYVDNGPQLPLWNRLPPLAFWFIPSLVGIPLILRSLRSRRMAALYQASSASDP